MQTLQNCLLTYLPAYPTTQPQFDKNISFIYFLFLVSWRCYKVNLKYHQFVDKRFMKKTLKCTTYLLNDTKINSFSFSMHLAAPFALPATIDKISNAYFYKTELQWAKIKIHNTLIRYIRENGQVSLQAKQAGLCQCQTSCLDGVSEGFVRSNLFWIVGDHA